MEVLKKIPTPSLVEQYQQKILQGITEINTSLQKLSLEDRVEYFSMVAMSLAFRIRQVRSYITQLSAPERAQDLITMQVVEQDLMRTIALVQNLQDEDRRLKDTPDTVKPSSKVLLRKRSDDKTPAPAIKPDQLQLTSPRRRSVAESSERSARKGILRKPCEKNSEGPIPDREGYKVTGKVKAMKEELGLK